MTKQNWPTRLDWLLRRMDSFFSMLGLRLTRRDFDIRHVPEWQKSIVRDVASYTATDGPALIGLLDAIAYLEHNAIPGAIVECGVYRGGSIMAAASGLLHHAPPRREIWLYDTFDGMTAPDSYDIRTRDGLAARIVYESEQTLPEEQQSDWFWVREAVDAVRSNVALSGYPDHLTRFVVGRVEDTIPLEVPSRIALLRLDTDWYASTKHELEHLVPRLSPGGVIIIDDYHYWQGARKAADEYFTQALGRIPLWTRISSSGAVIATL